MGVIAVISYFVVVVVNSVSLWNSGKYYLFIYFY